MRCLCVYGVMKTRITNFTVDVLSLSFNCYAIRVVKSAVEFSRASRPLCIQNVVSFHLYYSINMKHDSTKYPKMGIACPCSAQNADFYDYMTVFSVPSSLPKTGSANLMFWPLETLKITFYDSSLLEYSQQHVEVAIQTYLATYHVVLLWAVPKRVTQTGMSLVSARVPILCSR